MGLLDYATSDLQWQWRRRDASAWGFLDEGDIAAGWFEAQGNITNPGQTLGKRANGAFVIQQNNDGNNGQDQAYTLCFKKGSTIHRYPISNTRNGWGLSGAEDHFDTLTRLVTFYVRTPDSGLPLRLVPPAGWRPAPPAPASAGSARRRQSSVSSEGGSETEPSSESGAELELAHVKDLVQEMVQEELQKVRDADAAAAGTRFGQFDDGDAVLDAMLKPSPQSPQSPQSTRTKKLAATASGASSGGDAVHTTHRGPPQTASARGERERQTQPARSDHDGGRFGGRDGLGGLTPTDPLLAGLAGLRLGLTDRGRNGGDTGLGMGSSLAANMAIIEAVASGWVKPDDILKTLADVDTRATSAARAARATEAERDDKAPMDRRAAAPEDVAESVTNAEAAAAAAAAATAKVTAAAANAATAEATAAANAAAAAAVAVAAAAAASNVHGNHANYGFPQYPSPPWWGTFPPGGMPPPGMGMDMPPHPWTAHPANMAGAAPQPGYPYGGWGMVPGMPPGMPAMTAMPGMAMPRMAMPGMAMPGMAMPGMAMPGMAMPGMHPPGMAMPGMHEPAANPTANPKDAGGNVNVHYTSKSHAKKKKKTKPTPPTPPTPKPKEIPNKWTEPQLGSAYTREVYVEDVNLGGKPQSMVSPADLGVGSPPAQGAHWTPPAFKRVYTAEEYVEDVPIVTQSEASLADPFAGFHDEGGRMWTPSHPSTAHARESYVEDVIMDPQPQLSQPVFPSSGITHHGVTTTPATRQRYGEQGVTAPNMPPPQSRAHPSAEPTRQSWAGHLGRASIASTMRSINLPDFDSNHRLSVGSHASAPHSRNSLARLRQQSSASIMSESQYPDYSQVERSSAPRRNMPAEWEASGPRRTLSVDDDRDIVARRVWNSDGELAARGDGPTAHHASGRHLVRPAARPSMGSRVKQFERKANSQRSR